MCIDIDGIVVAVGLKTEAKCYVSLINATTTTTKLPSSLAGRLAHCKVKSLTSGRSAHRQTGGIKLKLIVGLKNNSLFDPMYFINVSIFNI